MNKGRSVWQVNVSLKKQKISDTYIYLEYVLNYTFNIKCGYGVIAF